MKNKLHVEGSDFFQLYEDVFFDGGGVTNGDTYENGQSYDISPAKSYVWNSKGRATLPGEGESDGRGLG